MARALGVLWMVTMFSPSGANNWYADVRCLIVQPCLNLAGGMSAHSGSQRARRRRARGGGEPSADAAAYVSQVARAASSHVQSGGGGAGRVAAAPAASR